MSWSSLFAFSNPNGRIGSTYTAVNSTTLNSDFVGDTAAGTYYQNLAIFTGLPVGVYSVQVSIPLTNSGGGPDLIINNWNIGAGTSNSSVALASNSITGFSTTCESVISANSTAIISFFLNNTAGTSPIYINSFINTGSNNIILIFASTFSTTATIVATKLA